MEDTQLRFIITGGGTGGHIFPAIAIADALRRRYPSCDILFIGAEGKLEMEWVPKAGYEIKSIPLSGLDRKHLLRNFKVFFQFFRGINLAKKYLQDFRPHCVIGVGGYVSAPTVLTAQAMGIPTLIQEQNSFAGVANKRLARKADVICVAYEGMDRFFPKEHIILTGNPIRETIEKKPLPSRKAALKSFCFTTEERPTILVVGGSLGALTINESIASELPLLIQHGVRILWQTGKSFYPKATKLLQEIDSKSNTTSEGGNTLIKAVPFIDDMASAYAIADLLIARAGASTISEIQYLGLPSILVPSPNVAEDHQTHNALALVNKGAAKLVRDNEARMKLVHEAVALVSNHEELVRIKKNALEMRLPNAANRIVDEINLLICHEKRRN